MNTFYWHDYETWGVNPAVDRPAQFAGLRTTETLEVIGEPLMLYCRPAEDILPQPEACLVTGIAPQKAEAEGVSEAEFMCQVLAQLGQPGTCALGYNTLRFDDEVTRYSAYRNFYDPYEREWQNGNSRWDIIDLVRTCYALRPEGIEWPMVDGRPSFRLEHLTAANGIGHGNAHDALADVQATIALAKLVKHRQPALFHHLYELRAKQKVAGLFDWQNRKPLLHISSMFKAEQGCASLVLPLAPHPTNKNAVIVVDLLASPEDLIQLDAEAVAARVFTAQAELPEGVARIALKAVHLNKCPVLLPPNALTGPLAKRLGIDLEACERHWQRLLREDLTAKVQQVMGRSEFSVRTDPEQQLYDAFIAKQDRTVMAEVREADVNGLRERNFVFADKRLQEMLWRYKARNFSGSLTAREQAQWFEFCQARLGEGEAGIASVTELHQRIRTIDSEQNLSKAQKIVLQQLGRYANDLAKKYQLGNKCQW